MNVSSSISTQMLQTTSVSSKNSNLSSEQKALIEDVLSNYDTESLSANDASEIIVAFQEAGIVPSQALVSTMEASGFDAKEVGDLAAASTQSASRPAGGRPPPPPSAEDEEEVASIYDLLETLLAEDEEDESSSTISSISSLLLGTGYEDEGSSFETVLDYTSKIIRLKDDARSDVMNIINEFSADETNMQNKDTQKNLLTSLSEILNKTDNYNTISFYA